MPGKSELLLLLLLALELLIGAKLAPRHRLRPPPPPTLRKMAAIKLLWTAFFISRSASRSTTLTLYSRAPLPHFTRDALCAKRTSPLTLPGAVSDNSPEPAAASTRSAVIAHRDALAKFASH